MARPPIWAACLNGNRLCHHHGFIARSFRDTRHNQQWLRIVPAIHTRKVEVPGGEGQLHTRHGAVHLYHRAHCTCEVAAKPTVEATQPPCRVSYGVHTLRHGECTPPLCKGLRVYFGRLASVGIAREYRGAFDHDASRHLQAQATKHAQTHTHTTTNGSAEPRWRTIHTRTPSTPRAEPRSPLVRRGLRN